MLFRSDTAAGDSKPETEALFSLLNMDKVRAYDNYTVDEMLNVASFNQHRIPAENAFTSAGKFMLHPLSGHEEQKEPFAIISRDYVTLYGYEMDEGGFVPMHRREENQVLINHSGDVLIRFEDENLMPILLGPGDVYDLPKGLGYKPEGIRDTSFT